MAKKSGNSFGSFNQITVLDVNKVLPIRTEFSKGSVPNSLYSINFESAWSRWRRGFELYCNSTYNQIYSYPFDYLIPLPPGTVIPPVQIHHEFQALFKDSRLKTKNLECIGRVFVLLVAFVSTT
jgi:N-acetylmuramoyl-L-alanine amidase